MVARGERVRSYELAISQGALGLLSLLGFCIHGISYDPESEYGHGKGVAAIQGVAVEQLSDGLVAIFCSCQSAKPITLLHATTISSQRIPERAAVLGLVSMDDGCGYMALPYFQKVGLNRMLAADTMVHLSESFRSLHIRGWEPYTRASAGQNRRM